MTSDASSKIIGHLRDAHPTFATMLALGLAAAAFTAPPALLQNAVTVSSTPLDISMNMNTRDTGPKKKKPSSARSLLGYRVGDRAPASAIRSGTTKAK